MVRAQDAFAELIRRGIRPALKSEGFTGKGRSTFLREGRDCVDLIEYQKSVASDSDIVRFTANIGIVSKRLLSFAEPDWRGRTLRMDDCHWQSRLGRLLPNPHDAWWELRSNQSVEPMVKEQLGYLRDYVLPTLVRYSSDQSLLDEWRADRSPGLMEFQRLKNLVVLLDSPATAEEQGHWIAALKEYAAQRGQSGRVEVLLDDLKGQTR